MKYFLILFVTIPLAACQTLGALGVKKIGQDRGKPVYEVHSMTVRGYLTRTNIVYGGSEEYKAYKRLPVAQQTLTDTEFRQRELDKQARKKCSGNYKIVQNFTAGYARYGASVSRTSKFHFVCR